MHYCSAPGIIGQIVSVALGIIASLGWFGAALIVSVENILPFIPSEVILPAVGMTAIQGGFGVEGIPAVVIAVVVVTLASVVGAIILFQVSRMIGVERVAKLPFINREGLERAEASFAKHGCAAVFFCRFIPVVRVLVTIPAGLSDMSKRKFLVFTTLGSLIWNTIFVSIGAGIGSAWCEIEPVFSHYSHLTVAVLAVLVIAAWFVKKKLHSAPKSISKGIEKPAEKSDSE